MSHSLPPEKSEHVANALSSQSLTAAIHGVEWFPAKKIHDYEFNDYIFRFSPAFQTHLICTVPPYINPDTIEPAPVQLFVTSSNKCSESHNFIYTPKNNAFGSHSALAMATTLAALQAHSSNSQGILWVFIYKSASETISLETKAKKKQISKPTDARLRTKIVISKTKIFQQKWEISPNPSNWIAPHAHKIKN